MITGAVADIIDALVATLSDTRLESDLEDLLWSTVNLFHRRFNRERQHFPSPNIRRRSSPCRVFHRELPWPYLFDRIARYPSRVLAKR